MAQPKAKPPGLNAYINDQIPKALPNEGQDDPNDRFPAFSFYYVDNCGLSFGWDIKENAHEVVNFIHSISRNKWKEIKALDYNGKGGYRAPLLKSMAFDAVDAPAEARVKALKLHYVFDELSRFRIGSDGRLWGCIRGEVFYVLWWDPDHQVYSLSN